MQPPPNIPPLPPINAPMTPMAHISQIMLGLMWQRFYQSLWEKSGNLKQGSTAWMQAAPNIPMAWMEQIQQLSHQPQAEALPPALAQAGMEVIEKRMRAITQSLLAIEENRHHMRPHPSQAGHVIWQKGNSVLRHLYGRESAGTKPILLLVPSLINGWWIMDIHEKRSFAASMADAGMDVMVMDWGQPAEAETGFSISDYITQRLLPVMDWLDAEYDRRVMLGGYCMGGMMAIAAAQIRPNLCRALLLIATPWDFHAAGCQPAQLLPKTESLLTVMLKDYKRLPGWMLQPMFYRHDMWQYADMLLRQQHRRDAVAMAVQCWLHEASDISSAALHQCLVEWFGQNRPNMGQWNINGQTITPQTIRSPCLAITAKQDRLVPITSSLALDGLLPQVDWLMPSTGHLGLMVSQRAKNGWWQDMAEWLLRCSA